MGKTFGTKPHSECLRCKANLHNICGLFEETEGAADFGHVNWCALACKAASLASRGGGGGGAAAAAAAAGAPLQPAPTCATGFPWSVGTSCPHSAACTEASARGCPWSTARGPLALALPPVSQAAARGPARALLPVPQAATRAPPVWDLPPLRIF